MLDIRTAQTTLENLLRDVILQGLGWRLPAVANVAALRAVSTQGASGPIRSDDDLIVEQAGPASYRWSSASTAADDGAAVVQPSDVLGAAPGRWLRWSTRVRRQPDLDDPSVTLDALTAGPLRRVLVLDRDMPEEDIENLVAGQYPAVVIEATGDQPDDLLSNRGVLWATEWEFAITTIHRNFRDRREHAQGSTLDRAGIDSWGANRIDGEIIALLLSGGVVQAYSGLRGIKTGSGENRVSDFGQRLCYRRRQFTVQATACRAQPANELVQLGNGLGLYAQPVLRNADGSEPADYGPEQEIIAP